MTVVAERPMTISPTASSGQERERRDELALAALPSAIPLVRLLVQHDLANWSFEQAFIRRVEQVAEVLARHAVATTGITTDAPLYSEVFDALRVIVVRLRVFADRVVVEMWDQANTAADQSLSQKLTAVGSEAWGYGFPGPGQRVVWCVVAVEPPLPRRTPKAKNHRASAAEVARGVDTAFLRRILDGLQRNVSTDRVDGDEPAR